MNSCRCCGQLTKNQNFCSRSCAAKVNNNIKPKRKKTLVLHECKSCGCKTKNLSYCTNKCQRELSKRTTIVAWLAGDTSAAVSGPSGQLSGTVKKWLLEQAGYTCTRCGWGEKHPLTGKTPVEVDHINGDRFDHRFENLRVLCPNCHALTHTYKALNSRFSRKKYGARHGVED